MRLFTKERVASGVIYGVMQPLTIFLPSLIAIAFGVSKVKAFCKQHADICSQYPDNKPLNRVVEEAAYSSYSFFWYGFSLFLFTSIPCMVAYKSRKCVYIPRHRQNLLLRAGGRAKEEFKVFKCFFTSSMFIASLLSYGFEFILINQQLLDLVCASTDKAKQPCDYYFPNATKHEADLLNNLEDKMFTTMMIAGPVSLLLMWTLIGVSVFAKWRMCRDAASVQEDGGDEPDGSEVVPLNGF